MLHIQLMEKIYGTVNLVACKAIPKLNLGNMMANVLDKWIGLLR